MNTILLPLSLTQKLTSRKKILLNWRGQDRNKSLFRRPPSSTLSDPYRNVGWPLQRMFTLEKKSLIGLCKPCSLYVYIVGFTKASQELSPNKAFIILDSLIKERHAHISNFDFKQKRRQPSIGNSRNQTARISMQKWRRFYFRDFRYNRIYLMRSTYIYLQVYVHSKFTKMLFSKHTYLCMWR